MSRPLDEPLSGEPLDVAFVSPGEWGDEVERLISKLQAAFHEPDLSAEKARSLAKYAESEAAKIRRRLDQEEIGRLRRELEAQASTVRKLASDFDRSLATVRNSLAAGQCGLWECRLQDERVTWSDNVYELFDLPQGSVVHRKDMLDSYTEASLRHLEDTRSRALQTGGRFRLAAEIRTAKGHRRWIRINGVVERRNGLAERLYGMKQDITEERALAEDARRLAEVDPLTNLANRRLFQEKLSELADRSDAALLLVDLDGFKQINDTFGHLAGDDMLRRTAARLRLACRDTALVARIGGDEFAVLFNEGIDRLALERRAQDVVEALRIPVRQGDFMLELGASAGVARSERTGAQDWISRADVALYAAKAAGRGTYRVYSPAMVRSHAGVAARRLEAQRLAG